MAELRDLFCHSYTVSLHSELKKRGEKKKWMAEYDSFPFMELGGTFICRQPFNSKTCGALARAAKKC